MTQTSRRSLLYSLTALAFISFSMALIYSGYHIHQLKLKTLSASLEKGAESMNQFFANRLVEMSLYAEHNAMQSMEFEHIRPLLLAKLKQQSSIYEKFIIGTPEGHFYNTAGGNPYHQGLRSFDDQDPDAKLKSISKRDYWKKTVGENRYQKPISYISNPMISYTTGVKQVVVASSIIDNQNRLVGLIGGSIAWNTITELVADTKAYIADQFPMSARVLLVSDDGHYWYHWDAERIIHYDKTQDTLPNNNMELKTTVSNILKEPDSALRNLGVTIVAGGTGYAALDVTEMDFDGYVFYAPIRDANYSLAIFVDNSYVTSELRWMIAIHIALLLFTLITGGCIFKRKRIPAPETTK